MNWKSCQVATKFCFPESFYDSNGFLVWAEQRHSPRQYYVYDGNGQQTHSWYNVADPSGTNEFLTVVSWAPSNFTGPSYPLSDSTPQDRGLDNVQIEIVGGVEYDHDNFDDLEVKINAHESDEFVSKASESTSVVNDRGLAVETRSLAVSSDGVYHWYITRVAYDSAGRIEYQTDSYRADTPTSDIAGVQNHYDSEGPPLEIRAAPRA